MKKKMKTVGEIIIILAMAILVMFTLNKAEARQEKNDCLKWQGWEQDYPLYNPSSSTISECQALGVNLKK